MPFSQRTLWNLEANALESARQRHLAAGLPLADLTASNPTRCGFTYPSDLLAPLSNPIAFNYDPNPRGSIHAREAICRYYQAHSAAISPNQIILTTSTSEAYSFLFKLLCNPGEAILAPQPCYPLFDFLADAEVVTLTHSHFVYDHGWQLDLESLRRAITPATRAIVLVHPNNPTGHFTTLQQARELAALCREHALALIVDEVFLDYAFHSTPADSTTANTATFLARDLGVLTFVVSGISKVCALPQMKAAWLVATGPGAEEALERLEVIADTFLSMNAPIQSALPIWLENCSSIQEQIRLRTSSNLAILDRELEAQPLSSRWISRLSVEGGWYAILRVPATETDEEAAIRLLDQDVYIHPGSFFGLPSSGWLVASLLTPGPDFQAGISSLIRHFQQNHNN
jgi:alanine-synthesizing transaminase